MGTLAVGHHLWRKPRSKPNQTPRCPLCPCSHAHPPSHAAGAAADTVKAPIWASVAAWEPGSKRGWEEKGAKVYRSLGEQGGLPGGWGRGTAQ